MKPDVDPLQYQNPGWEPFRREFMEDRAMEERDLRLHTMGPLEWQGPGRGGLPDCAVKNGDSGQGIPTRASCSIGVEAVGNWSTGWKLG